MGQLSVPVPNHSELQRDIGRMEGKQDAMGARLDRLEKIIEDGFDRINQRLAGLEASENKRKGAVSFLTVIASVISALAAVLGVDWIKGG